MSHFYSLWQDETSSALVLIGEIQAVLLSHIAMRGGKRALSLFFFFCIAATELTSESADTETRHKTYKCPIIVASKREAFKN